MVFVSVIAGVSPAGAQPSEEPEDAEAPEWLGAEFGGYQASRPDDDPVSPPVQPAESAPPIEDTPVDPAAPALPEPGVVEVTLGDEGAARAAGEAPIEVAAASEAAEGVSLRVEVLERAVAERAGVSGMVFTLGPGEGAPALGEGAPVEVAIDVSGFEGLYGSAYTDRLRVAALPACALAEARPAGCETTGVDLPVERDHENDRLIVEVEDLSQLVAAGLEGDVPTELPPPPAEPAPGAPAEEPTTTTEAPSTTTTAPASTPEATTPDEESPAETTSTTAADTDGTAEDESAPDAEGEPAAAPASAAGGTAMATLAGVGRQEPPPTPEEEGDEPASVTQLDVPAGQGEVVFALLADVSGDEGTFAATPLSLTSDWQVGEGSGEFNWNYPVPVPAPPAGPAPDVAVSYSSGSVDGMVTTRNTQSGKVGLGWADFASSFIERRYAPCYEEAGVAGMGSQCWRTDNATISLNGRASELVPVPATTNQWRLRDDPNWRVERFTAADDPAMDNGDNDGEHWRVTSPDGTEYWFGLGRNPDTGDETLSTFTAPVFGDDSGDPCHAAGPPMGWCQQAWRWNLDRVVDPNDNEAVYFYGQETNFYNAGTDHGILPYVRAGRISEIWYGKRAGTQQLPTAKVIFDADWRCASLDEPGQPPCPEPTSANGTEFPDVPNDLICTATTCNIGSPAFFTGLRYTEITTQIQTVPGQEVYEPVDRVRLTHTFQEPEPDRFKLWLTGLQRTGLTGETELAMPGINFLGAAQPNRADPPAGGSSLPHHRLGVIEDEFGRQIIVDYGQPDPCPDPIPTSGWDTNTANCFPQQWTPDGATEANFAVFHKYLVERVRVRDPDGGTASPEMVHDYQYDTTVGAAWHHDDDELVPNSDQSWSDWRGYATVTVVNGSSRTRTRVFRGMHGDRVVGDPAGGPGTKTASLTPLDGGSPVTDSNWLAGRVLDTAQLNAGGNTVVGTLTTYTAAVTANSPAADPNEDARWVAPATVTERRRTPVAGFASRRTATAYTPTRQPWLVLEEGWLDQTGDERCTGTTYATNASLFMLSYKSEEVVVEGDCSSPTERRRSQFHYDGAGLNVAPTRGNVTATRSRITSATWTPYTETTHDPLGRPLVATDANGHTTTTTYAPATGNPDTTTVTNHLGHDQVTAWNVRRGVPGSETDPNGNDTSYAYDGLGRVTEVRQPTEQGGGPASWQFEYVLDLDKNAPPVVRTRQLVDPAIPTDPYIDTWTVYDANLRERQTHRDSPAAGQVIVTDTAYDGQGNIASVSLPQAVTGTPGSGLLGTGSWANTTRTSYDELSRPTNEEFFQNATERWQTTTSYTHNATTVQPPTGGATLTVTDAYDRVARVEEEDGSNWRATAYTYNAGDDLLTVTDPAGNIITNTYDMLGRKTGMDDPDAGDWTYAYDPVGNQTRSTDATGTQLHTIYDQLNRPTERRQNSTTGPVLASWDYDATGELGLLDSSTRHHTTGDWTVDVTGYDNRSRPTGRTWTVPAGVTGLAGDYTVSYGYDRADHQTSVTYPAVGGLAQETVTTTYNTLGLAETMIGDEDYLWGAVYDNRARPQWFLSGDTATPFNRVWQYNNDQRLARMQAAGGSTPLQDHQFAYDDTGNITERNTFLAGDAWRECFDYDDRQRLTGAFTTSGTCAAGSPGTGDAPYEHTYTYSADGNLTSRDEGATTYDYTYPAPGGTRPHAPTDVEGDTYTWNANGDLDTRTIDGQTHDLTWDPERRLTTVDDPDGDTTYIYDADGNRLLRQTPDNTTLYIESHEIVHDGAALSAVRMMRFDGTVLASRTSSGVEYIAVDNQGSVQLAVGSGATSALASRRYLPYGLPRTPDVTSTDHGWLSQIEDASAGLNYLNARYYDAAIGMFMSPDPLYDARRPKTVNPYAYGLSSPTSAADPTGLWVPVDDAGILGYDARWKSSGNGGFSRPLTPSVRRAAGLGGHVSEATLDLALPEEYRNLIVEPGVPVERSAGPFGDDRLLSVAEDELCRIAVSNVLNLRNCMTARSLAQEAEALVPHTPLDDSTAMNAHRHMYWAARLTIRIGPEAAREFLDAHEGISDGRLLTGEPLDRNAKMDLINNDVGIAIGTQVRQEMTMSDTTADVHNAVQHQILMSLYYESVWVRDRTDPPA